MPRLFAQIAPVRRLTYVRWTAEGNPPAALTRNDSLAEEPGPERLNAKLPRSRDASLVLAARSAASPSDWLGVGTCPA